MNIKIFYSFQHDPKVIAFGLLNTLYFFVQTMSQEPLIIMASNVLMYLTDESIKLLDYNLSFEAIRNCLNRKYSIALG